MECRVQNGLQFKKWSAWLHSALQSNNWSGVLVGVQQSTFQKNDWLKNGLHSKIIFGFGLWIALQILECSNALQESNNIKIRESKSISSIAQLVERWLLIHKVMGSNPARGRNSFIASSYRWQPRRPIESNKIKFRVRRSNKKNISPELGLEPTTFWMRGQHFTNWAIELIFKLKFMFSKT